MSELRQEPADLAAERAVLGAVLVDPNAIIGLAPILTPADFYDQEHAAVYTAMLALYRQRIPVDFITLHGELSRPSYGYGGGVALMTDLAAEHVTSVHAPYYADKVARAATRRRYLRACEEGLKAAYDDALDIDEVAARIDGAMLEARQQGRQDDYLPLPQAVESTMDVLDTERRHERLVFTGYHQLDRQIGGFEPGQLIVVAGRPGAGKTAAAVQLAYEHGVKKRRPVGFLSLEMSEHAIVARLMAIRGQIDMHAVRQIPAKERPDDLHNRLLEAAGYVSNGKVWIIRRRSQEIAVVAAQARDMQSRFGIECLIVDYLQLMSGGKKENRTQEVSAVSRGLKLIAMDLEIPVVALAQLNRDVERRGGDSIPRLSDLRESGSIEQDADIVVFLHRDTQERIEFSQDASFIVAKHREGPTGTIPMRWFPRTEEYHDPAWTGGN